MLKKTIKYTDFNGEEVTEDFFFHLSKAEIIELEMSHKDGLSAAMQKLIDAEDGKAILAEFKRIILMSYGVKSEDGKRFIKNQILRDEFEGSEAYSELIMELVTNADAATAFVNGILPPGLTEQVENLGATSPPEPKVETRVITVAEAERMERQEFYRQLRAGEIVLGGDD